MTVTKSNHGKRTVEAQVSLLIKVQFNNLAGAGLCIISFDVFAS